MSQENVDRFLEVAKSFNRLAEADVDAGTVDDYLRFWDPDVRFEPQQAALEGGYAGHAGIRAWLGDIAEHYERGHAHYSEVRDLGDRVLGLGILRVTGRGSGIDIKVPLAVVATYRGGLMTHFKDYGDKDQALEAVGLTK